MAHSAPCVDSTLHIPENIKNEYKRNSKHCMPSLMLPRSLSQKHSAQIHYLLNSHQHDAL